MPPKKSAQARREAALAELSQPAKKPRGFLGGKSVSDKALTLFTSQLAILQDAGLPIVRCLKILEGQMKPGYFKWVLGSVKEDVESGSPLSEAMAKHPGVFDDLYTGYSLGVTPDREPSRRVHLLALVRFGVALHADLGDGPVLGELMEELLERGALAVQLPQDPLLLCGHSEDLGAELGLAGDTQPGPHPAPVLGGIHGVDSGERSEGVPDARPLDLHRVVRQALPGGDQVVDGAVGDQPAAVDDDEPIADRLHLLHDVGAEQDRPLATQFTHQRPDVDALVGVQPLGRLVQDQDFGPVQDGCRQTDALSISLGELSDGAKEDRFQPGLAHRIGDGAAGP